jgi:hypothetical protein
MNGIFLHGDIYIYLEFVRGLVVENLKVFTHKTTM